MINVINLQSYGMLHSYQTENIKMMTLCSHSIKEVLSMGKTMIS